MKKKAILLLFCQSVAMSLNAFFLICGMCSLVRHCVFVCWSVIVSLYVYFYAYVYVCVCVSIHRCLSLFLCLSLYLSIICLPFGREHFSISGVLRQFSEVMHDKMSTIKTTVRFCLTIFHFFLL